MSITLLKANQRSACFEINCGDDYIYKSPHKYKVYINGDLHTSGDLNVFSVFGLRPDMLYSLRVEFDNGTELRHEFVTPKERLFLDVEKFGCVGDGIKDCTNALQSAINACGKDGGTVYVKKGTYLTYPLFVNSNVLLYLDEGAVLLGGTDRTNYPILPGIVMNENETNEQTFGTWEGNPLDSFASLITTIDSCNVVIAGQGTIDANAGNGDWWQNHKTKKIAWRPRTVFAVRATDFTLMGITIKNSPSWTVHPYYCTNVDILNISINNPSDTPNTDGCNPESTENVRIIGSEISVGDDCIAVKSGKYYMSVYHPRPSKNILVRNCLLKRGHGAVVVGSEISSGVYNLTVERCLMQNTDRGLRIKTRRGRGSKSIVDKVSFCNIFMDGVLTPFSVNMFYNCDPDGHTDMVRNKGKGNFVNELTPYIGNITCRHITCIDAAYAGVFLYGLPENPVESFDMKDVKIFFNHNAEKGMPDMMDDFEPIQNLTMFVTNVKRLRISDVEFDGYGEKYLQLNDIDDPIVVMEGVPNE